MNPPEASVEDARTFKAEKSGNSTITIEYARPYESQQYCFSWTLPRSSLFHNSWKISAKGDDLSSVHWVWRRL